MPELMLYPILGYPKKTNVWILWYLKRLTFCFVIHGYGFKIKFRMNWKIRESIRRFYIMNIKYRVKGF